MCYRNSSLPIVVCIDMCSRKGLWVKVLISNSNPNLIGRFYLEFLFKTGRIASKLRLDKGTETSGVATMQAYLPQQHSVMKDFHDGHGHRLQTR